MSAQTSKYIADKIFLRSFYKSDKFLFYRFSDNEA